MEWLRRKWQQASDAVVGVFRGPPEEPSRPQWQAAYQQVADASAQLHDAYGARATAWALQYDGQDYAVTSAHAAVNYYRGSKAFHFEGRHYLVLVKGDQVALAEHVAFNPQGGPCSRTPGVATTGEPISDLSILRIVSPEQTRRILHEFSFTPDLSTRFHAILRGNPSLAVHARDGVLTAEELTAMTARFHLRPIPMDETREQRSDRVRTPTIYSMGYLNNRPELVRGTLQASEDGRIAMRYTPSNQLVPGFSGGLMFDVSETGRLVPLGINANNVASDCTAYAVTVDRLREGLRSLSSLRLTLNELRALCQAGENGPSQWLSPRGYIEAQSPPHTPRSGAPAQCLASR